MSNPNHPIGIFCILAFMNFNFGQAYILWSLSAITIPIWLHLFYKNKRIQIYFSDIRILKSVQNKGGGFKWIRNIYLLVFRLLALICLILGLADPFVKSKPNKTRENYVIYVDNHLGLLQGNRTNYLALNQQISPSNDPITLFKNGNNALDEIKTWNDLKQAWSELGSSYPSDSLDQIISKAQTQFSDIDQPQKSSILWISDFPKNQKLPNISKDSKVKIWPIQPLKAANLIVDSLWQESGFVQLGKPFGLHVRIKNVGNLPSEKISIQFLMENFSLAKEFVTLLPGQSKDFMYQVSLTKSGGQQARIVSNDAVGFDNNFYFFLKPTVKRMVYLVGSNESNRLFSTVFAKDSLFDFRSISKQTFHFSRQQMAGFLMVTNFQDWSLTDVEEFFSWIKQGNSGVIIPDVISASSLVSLLNTELMHQGIQFSKLSTAGAIPVAKPNMGQALLEQIVDRKSMVENIEMFSTKPLLSWQNGPSTILKFVNNTPFESKFKLGVGDLFLFSSDFLNERNGFIKNGFFLPLFQEMALQSNPMTRLSTRMSSQNFIFQAPKNWKFQSPEKNLLQLVKFGKTWIPEQKWIDNAWVCSWPADIPQDFVGFYESQVGNQNVGQLAVNYPKSASSVGSYSIKELKEYVSNKPQIKLVASVDPLEFLNQGTSENISVAPYFFAAALLFFLLEMAWLTFSSNAWRHK